MNAMLNDLPAGEAPKYDHPRLKIFMACQDHLAGVDVVGALTELARRGGGTPEMTIQDVWSFAMLENPRLRNLAAREASRADLVIVRTRGHGEFPDDVRKWLHLWVGDEGSSTKALVVLLDEPETELAQPFPIATYLQHCARLARLKFMVRNVGDEPGLEELGILAAGERALHTADVIHQVLRDCWTSNFMPAFD